MVRILGFISLATLWYIALKINAGSNTWLSRLDICVLWNFPDSRNLVNSWEFLIVMSIAHFDLDLNDMGLPFTDMSCDILFVVNPSSKKSSFVFGWNESFPSF